jgi:peptidoglycan/xylan/chitin deacetylase (PgdA/CDA1 family)
MENSTGVNIQNIHANLKEDFRLLSWNEIQRLLETGLFNFGAHTLSHEILTNVPLDEAFTQINDAKATIEKHIPQEINLFAYPNGTDADYNDEHAHYLRDNGFIGSVTTTPKLNTLSTDPYRLGRICIGPELSTDFNHFSLKMSGLIDSVKSKMINVRTGMFDG